MPHIKAAATILLACSLGLSGCKFVKTADEQKEAAASAFDPDKRVAEIWDSKVIPFLEKRAGTLQEVSALATSDPNAAGAKYGHKEKQGNAPWTFAAKVDGTVVAAETKSRAAYVDVDVNGDAKADVRVAIGPAVRGTAIRDSLDFVDFNAFKNQIEWAQFGKSFNTHVNKMLLVKLPRDNLVGKKVQALGAYPLPSTGQLPQFVPATITIGG
jgi:predicted lipoprotein